MKIKDQERINETKDKIFLNELTICFLTVERTLEKERDASPASEILHSKCERDEVTMLQESSFLWRPLVSNNLTPLPFDKTQACARARTHARTHTHTHTHTSGALCSVQRFTSLVITFHIQYFFPCYQNEHQNSIQL
jgi:hypothetical protein